MIFRKIDISEKDKLAAMYEAVLVQQEKDEYGPKWTRGIYPCDIDYISHTEKGEYYGGFENERWRRCSRESSSGLPPGR